MKRLISIGFLVVVVGVVVAIKYLPWWASVALFAAFAVALKFCIRPLLTKLFLLPFKAKGAVLRGATIEVHSVRSAAPPPPSSEPSEATSAEDPAEAGPWNYYEVE